MECYDKPEQTRKKQVSRPENENIKLNRAERTLEREQTKQSSIRKNNKKEVAERELIQGVLVTLPLPNLTTQDEILLSLNFCSLK